MHILSIANMNIAIVISILFSIYSASLCLALPLQNSNHQSIYLHKPQNKNFILNNNIKKNKVKKITEYQQLEQKAEKVAKELEDVLASKLLNTMYEGLQPNPIVGGGSAEKLFQSLLNDERAKMMDLGLAKHVKHQIMQMSNGKRRQLKNATVGKKN